MKKNIIYKGEIMDIYGVKLSEKINENMFHKLLSLVAKEKQLRINRFIKWQDRQRTLIGDILIRILAVNKLELQNSNIFFTQNAYGKPCIKGKEDFHFNISHSGDWIVCTVDSASVGIDVEQIRPINLEIANRFFSKEEYNDLLNVSKENRLEYFYDLWTLKESYIKICGKGLSMPLDSFTIKKNNKGISVQSNGDNNNYFFKQYHVDDEYKLSVCSLNNGFPQNLSIMTFSQIYRDAIENLMG